MKHVVMIVGGIILVSALSYWGWGLLTPERGRRHMPARIQESSRPSVTTRDHRPVLPQSSSSIKSSQLEPPQARPVSPTELPAVMESPERTAVQAVHETEAPVAIVVERRQTPSVHEELQEAEERAKAEAEMVQSWNPLFDEIYGGGDAIPYQDVARMPDAVSVISPTYRVIDRGVLPEGVRDNPIRMLEEASIELSMTDQAIEGVQIVSMPMQGILSKMGFKPGDVIQYVDGLWIEDASKVTQLATTLLSPGRHEVRVRRIDGWIETLIFEVQETIP